MTQTVQTAPTVPSTKPARKDFYRTAVLSSAGTPVPETEWKGVVQDLQGREANKVLRTHGWQMVRVFARDQYKAAQSAYRSAVKATRVAFKANVINEAFEKAGTPKEPHLERALRNILPVLSKEPEHRIVTVLKNIIKTTTNAVSGNHQNPTTA